MKTPIIGLIIIVKLYAIWLINVTLVILSHTNNSSLRNRFGWLIDYILGKLYKLWKCTITSEWWFPVIHFKFSDVLQLVEKCKLDWVAFDLHKKGYTL